MKLRLIWLLLLPVAAISGVTYPEGTEWLPGRVLVNFTSAVGEIQTLKPIDGRLELGRTALDAILNRIEATAMSRIVPDQILNKLNPAPDAYRLVAINFSEKYDVLEVCDALSSLPEVVYAEPDLVYRTSTLPNDERWNQQWDKVLMNCPIAWDFGQGSREILAVAVDNGFFWSHPDARANLWVNPGEDLDGDGEAYWDADYPGDIDDLNGLDDDGNGYPDDLIGWDFIDNINGCRAGEDCDNPDNDTKSLGDHGSHTLGAIGAVGNNEIGVAGCNWNIRIMASRAGYEPAVGEGLIVTSFAIATINWAVAHGVDIINMSYGGGGFSNSVNNAIQAAWNNGAILCGASGNDGSSQIQYPCAYQNVICVGSVDRDDIVSDFSNYGTWVTCYAPGGGTLSLSIDNAYSNNQGTSMASPNAAGAVALVWSILPDLSNDQVRDLVVQNCEDITEENPDYNPDHLGTGRVDAANALAALLPYLFVEEVSIVGDDDNDGRLEAGETGELRLTVRNEENWFTATGVNVVVSTTDPNLSIPNGTFTISSLGGGQTTELSNPSAQITCTGSVPYAYTTSLNIRFEIEANIVLNRTATLRIGRARTLVVDDDNGANFASLFSAGLAQAGFNYDDYSIALDGPISATELGHYEDVVWACGNENTNTLTQTEREVLQGFLDAGNHLLFASQGADEDLDLRNSAFYGDYLHAASGGANGSPLIDGVAGDPISDGTSLLIAGGNCGQNGTVSPSVLTAVNGGVVFYNYRSSGLGCAVRFENATYKSVYFGFAIEAACGLNGSTHYSAVMRRTMEWFGATSDVDEAPTSVPESFFVSPAYPNPFNPEASVQIELARTSRVRATVHDVLGRQVQLIADRDASAGTHTIRVDGANLPSGSYWLNISVDNQNKVQRIILLK